MFNFASLIFDFNRYKSAKESLKDNYRRSFVLFPANIYLSELEEIMNIINYHKLYFEIRYKKQTFYSFIDIKKKFGDKIRKFELIVFEPYMRLCNEKVYFFTDYYLLSKNSIDFAKCIRKIISKRINPLNIIFDSKIWFSIFILSAVVPIVLYSIFGVVPPQITASIYIGSFFSCLIMGAFSALFNNSRVYLSYIFEVKEKFKRELLMLIGPLIAIILFVLTNIFKIH